MEEQPLDERDMSDHILYNEEFYSKRRNLVKPSAEAIIGHVFNLCNIESIVDFGCGTGTWIHTAQSLGAKHMLGIEADWLKEEYLDEPGLEVHRHDLTDSIYIDRKFDLAISLEVGEHLPEERARSFVEDICRTSTKVLFGAAIPEQGGTGHINEQWQSYWANLFLELDYRAFDVIRPKIWSDPEIPFWYKQNTILYLHKDELENKAQFLFSPQEVKPKDLDIVHPDLYRKKLRSNLVNQLEGIGLTHRLKIARKLPLDIAAAITRRIRK